MNIRVMLTGMLLILGCCLAGNPALAGSVGRIIAVTPGAFAEREGKTISLELKSAVYASDTLTTDTTGKLQVLFDDDSSLSLAPGTRLTLNTVIPGGNAPAFEARLGEGMARFITGKIVERNPDGFSVMTPESTIGIRGTIFAVQRNSGTATTSVFVLNTARQVIVNNISVPSEHKITLPGGRITPMTPADIRQVNVAAAARNRVPEAKNAETRTVPPILTALDKPDIPVSSNALASNTLLAQDTGSSITENITGSSSFNGTISGTLSGGNGVTGTFAFNANLGSGSINNAAMSGGNGGSTHFTASGGTGFINNARFGVYNNWSGSLAAGGPAQAITNAKMYGDVNISGSDINVNGDFRVQAPGGSYVTGPMTGGSN